MPARRLSFWLSCLPLLAATLPARAQAPEHATILHIDGDEIVIDAGRARVESAHELIVYRAIEVRHPITRKLLRDRFVIGSLQVVQPGEALSVTKASGAPAHPFAVGDVVELRAPPPTAAGEPVAATLAPDASSAPAQAAATDLPAGAPGSSTATLTAERELLSYWYASLAQDPERRARLYLAYLQRNPSSPYKDFVAGEIRYLRELDAKLMQQSRTAQAAPARPTRAATVDMLAVTGAQADRELQLAARVRPGPGFRGLVLHARPLEDAGYRSFTMQLDARGHARVRIPRELLRAPGLAYFIDAVDSAGQSGAVIADAEHPKLVVVRGPRPTPKHVERATRARFSSELASFDSTNARDYFWVNEGDFLYRVRHGALYGVRLGYGHFRGEGGTVQELDVDKLQPQPAGFSYGFFEAEFALHRLLGAALRGTLGLGRPEQAGSQRDGITGGFQVRARIGEADGTRLVLAGELMPEIGQRAFIGLAWEAIARVPMSTEIVVTDQPVNSDELAVRLIYEIGYRFSDRVSVALRPSYQLRTIRHAGPGIGVAATFDW
jgi:hypothetical protein